MLKAENFYLLRAPYLSLHHVEGLFDNATYSDALRRLYSDQKIKEAIFLASPILYNELESFLYTDNDKRRKVELALFKYLLRASTRSTPYGLFSGVALGLISDDTNIVLTKNDQHSSITRLDMQLLETIIENVVSHPEIKKRVKYYPNSSRYIVNDRLNYFESRMIGATKAFSLSSIEYTEFIHYIIEASQKGATKNELINLFDLENLDPDEVDHFIEDLIENKVIIHNLSPALTADNALEDVIEKVKSINSPAEPYLENIVQSLNKIKFIIENDKLVWNKKAEVEKELKNSFNIKDYSSDFFQVDLKLNKISNHVGKNIVDEVVSYAEELASIMPNSVVEDLETFKVKYIERYESQVMPLAEVLDSEYGIGYGNLSEHTIGGAELIGEVTNFKGESSMFLKMDILQDFQSRKFVEAIRNSLPQITITEQDILSLKKANRQLPVLPDSCYLLGNFISNNISELNQGNYKFKLDYFNGPSAATLFARFSHTDDDLIKHIKTAIKHEEAHKDAIYAEIVHSSQLRLGNVVQRPILRDYEIPYLSESAISNDRYILVEDLMVSIKQGEVLLWSKRLNKRVIPCLSSAQNFRFASLPIYKFLCDLQHQGIMASFVWNWGAFKTANYLPRVVYKKIIVSPAIWHINLKSLSPYKDKNVSDLYSAIASFRNEFNVPSRVMLLDGDNKLLIDLESHMCLDIISKQLLNNQTVIITESFISPDNYIVKDSEGASYAHEIIIPVSKVAGPLNQVKTPINIQPINIERNFNLGSEWLYCKIYGGNMIIENLLKNKLPELIGILESDQIIDKWFFIRYNDPDYHIRLRLHLKHEGHTGCVIDMINKVFEEELRANIIYKIQYDAYQREIERYGADMIQHCEDVFWRDSESILQMLNLNSDVKSPKRSMWHYALKSTHEYFNYFNIGLKERIQFTAGLTESFQKEFGDSKVLRNDLNKLYKENRITVEELFSASAEDNLVIDSILSNRTFKISIIIEEMNSYYSKRNVGKSNVPVLPSVIHMSINRIFPAYQRKYEMIVYHFLNRYYNKEYHSNN
jgi:thiopeptide-type bacteriocin biosynthesis protein